MHKLDREREMDVLVAQNKVNSSDMINLAKRIADFHKTANVIYDKNVFDVGDKFNDLGLEKEFLSENLGKDCAERIEQAMEKSNLFLKQNEKLLRDRLRSGFFRDCHGDLHTRNIFLLPEPQPFDCIEFNDDYRQIDVLNEVAFLCMDLDALGRNDLSEEFISHYNLLLNAMRNVEERRLFTFYKSYRANVRAKVNTLRAQSAEDESKRKNALSESERYLLLMESYLKTIDS
jgi:aminoglycoside phosphotransferase family enzyme